MMFLKIVMLIWNNLVSVENWVENSTWNWDFLSFLVKLVPFLLVIGDFSELNFLSKLVWVWGEPFHRIRLPFERLSLADFLYFEKMEFLEQNLEFVSLVRLTLKLLFRKLVFLPSLNREDFPFWIEKWSKWFAYPYYPWFSYRDFRFS